MGGGGEREWKSRNGARRIRKRGKRGMEAGKKEEKEGPGHRDGAWHVSRSGGVCVKEQQCLHPRAPARVDGAERALRMAAGAPDKPRLFRRATLGNFSSAASQIFPPWRRPQLTPANIAGHESINLMWALEIISTVGFTLISGLNGEKRKERYKRS